MNEEKVTTPQVTAPRRYEPICQDHARELVELMVKEFQPSSFRPSGATWAELMRKSGMKETTYQRALDWCTDHERFVGGGGRNLRDDLNPRPLHQVLVENLNSTQALLQRRVCLRLIPYFSKRRPPSSCGHRQHS